MDPVSLPARVATLGDIDANVSKMDEGERRIPIRVRLPEQDRADLSVIKNLRLPTASGGVTTLDSVADVYFQAGPGQINRVDCSLVTGNTPGIPRQTGQTRVFGAAPA